MKIDCPYLFRSISYSLLVISLVLCFNVQYTSGFDVNGDGREGLAETIHSLQVVSGLSPSYSTTLYVSASGSPTENGTALLNRLNGITDASDSNPYLIKLEPGLYDLQDQQLISKYRVSIEGSGKNSTTIKGMCSSEHNSVIEAVEDIRSLKVSIDVGGLTCTGLWVKSNITISDILVSMTGSGGGRIIGIRTTESPEITSAHVEINNLGTESARGIQTSDGSPLLINVTTNVTSVEGSAIGLYVLLSSKPNKIILSEFVAGSRDTNSYGIVLGGPSILKNVVASATSTSGVAYGLNVGTGTAEVVNSHFSSSSGDSNYRYGVYVAGSSTTLFMTNSIVEGRDGYDARGLVVEGEPTVIVNNSTFRATLTGTAGRAMGFEARNTDDIQLHNVVSEAQGGHDSYGLFLNASGLTASGVDSKASNAFASNQGVRLDPGSSLSFKNGSGTAKGGTHAFGLQVIETSIPAVAENSQFTATGSSVDSHGIRGNRSSLELQNIKSFAQGSGNAYGVSLIDSTDTGDFDVIIENSSITADAGGTFERAVSMDDEFNLYSSSTKFGGSDGVTVKAGSTYKCINTYDGSFNALNASCRP